MRFKILVTRTGRDAVAKSEYYEEREEIGKRNELCLRNEQPKTS